MAAPPPCGALLLLSVHCTSHLSRRGRPRRVIRANKSHVRVALSSHRLAARSTTVWLRTRGLASHRNIMPVIAGGDRDAHAGGVAMHGESATVSNIGVEPRVRERHIAPASREHGATAAPFALDGLHACNTKTNI